MTEQLTDTVPTTPVVRDFVARVREHLLDLDAEEQQELTAGLEADLGELAAERGPGALGHPEAYARELRVAAGHAPEMAPLPSGRGFRGAAMDALDSAHAAWDRVLDSVPGDLRGFLTTLQPTWWVLRGVVAWLVAQDIRGPWISSEPQWIVLLAVFVVGSVQLGRRRWGLGGPLTTSLAARVLLVGLNVFAVTMTPGAADRVAWHVAEQRAWAFDSGTDA